MKRVRVVWTERLTMEAAIEVPDDQELSSITDDQFTDKGVEVDSSGPDDVQVDLL